MLDMRKKTPAKAKIEAGYRVGSLTVEAATKERKSRYTVWRCRCDCGGEILLDTRALQRGAITDCGCRRRTRPGVLDLTGKRFGKLTALYPTDGRNKSGHVQWLCRCELCGAETVISSGELLSGNTKSCGNHAMSQVADGLQEGTSIRKLEYYRTRQFPLNSSGHTGVYQNKRSGKWIAEMTFQGKRVLYKRFASKEAAIAARKKAEGMIEGYLEEFYARHPEWNRHFYLQESN